MNAIELYQNNFQFLTNDVRIATDAANNPWFCAKDVCDVLDITWSSHTLDNMPENWFMVVNLTTIKGERDTYFVNEPGLYRLAFRSNKPAAENFANWVCEIVLPEIRRTGSFNKIDVKERIQLGRYISDLSESLLATKNSHRRALLMDELQLACRLANKPFPDEALLSQTIDQRDLFAGE
jgi:prophage antirepressor-like protein